VAPEIVGLNPDVLSKCGDNAVKIADIQIRSPEMIPVLYILDGAVDGSVMV
jgi:hypothetical protein